MCCITKMCYIWNTSRKTWYIYTVMFFFYIKFYVARLSGCIMSHICLGVVHVLCRAYFVMYSMCSVAHLSWCRTCVLSHILFDVLCSTGFYVLHLSWCVMPHICLGVAHVLCCTYCLMYYMCFVAHLPWYVMPHICLGVVHVYVAIFVLYNTQDVLQGGVEL